MIINTKTNNLKNRISPNGDLTNEKIIGKTKYSPIHIKEWKNAIYNFNKNNIKNLPIKTKIIDNILYSYFNLMFLHDVKTNKKRRIVHRNSKKIRRSLNKILLGKTEIKHTNDKSIINIYTLNNEKRAVKNKLFRLNLETKISNLYKTFNKQNTQYLVNFTKNIKKYSTFLKNKAINEILRKKILSNKNNFLKITSKLRNNKQGINRINRYKFKKYNYKNLYHYNDKLILHILTKKNYIKNVFFFNFLKWVFLLFNIRINTVNFKNKIEFSIKKTNNVEIIKSDISKQYFMKRINSINSILLSLLIKSINNNLIKGNIIVSLFNFFKKKYYNRYIRLLLKRERFSLIRLNMLNFNNLKFNNLVPKLKFMLTNILNSKIELNIINLKYLYMNADIFTQAIAAKLKRKTSRLLLILKRSLRLIKTPLVLTKSANLHNNFVNNRINFIKNYTNDKYKDININSFNYEEKDKKDILDLVVNDIFYKTRIKENNIKTKFNANIINSIKHKWTKGIRLEVKGRLTKRYTASRAVFKYIYLGNLRNNVKSFMIRGDNKSNIQYSFTSSKRRIGSFGVKGWISTI